MQTESDRPTPTAPEAAGRARRTRELTPNAWGAFAPPAPWWEEIPCLPTQEDGATVEPGSAGRLGPAASITAPGGERLIQGKGVPRMARFASIFTALAAIFMIAGAASAKY